MAGLTRPFTSGPKGRKVFQRLPCMPQAPFGCRLVGRWADFSSAYKPLSLVPGPVGLRMPAGPGPELSVSPIKAETVSFVKGF